MAPFLILDGLDCMFGLLIDDGETRGWLGTDVEPGPSRPGPASVAISPGANLKLAFTCFPRRHWQVHSLEVLLASGIWNLHNWFCEENRSLVLCFGMRYVLLLQANFAGFFSCESGRQTT